MGLLDRFFKKNQEEQEVEVPPEQRPARNEVCWCGSGLKYKKCHMDKDLLYLARKKEKDLDEKKSCSPVFG